MRYICIFLVLTSYSSRSWPVNYILSLCIYLFVSTYEHDYIKLDLRSKLTVSLLYVITSLGQYWRMAWHISPECLGWAGPSPHPMCDRGPAWLSRTLLSSVTVDTGLGGWGHLFAIRQIFGQHEIAPWLFAPCLILLIGKSSHQNVKISSMLYSWIFTGLSPN